MKRQLNLRFLALVAVVAAVTAGGAYALHELQVRRNAGYLLTRGEQAEKDGNVRTAIDYYARYLSLRSDDARAWGRYGLLLATNAGSRKGKELAYLTLERALRDDPAQPDVRRRTADLAFELGRFADAMAHAKALLDKGEDPDVLELIGRCEEEVGQPSAAEKEQAVREKRSVSPAEQWYLRAIAAAPQRVEPYLRLATLHRRAGQDELANGVMDRLVEANPSADLFRPRLARARYSRELGMYDAAEKDLQVARSGAGRDDPEVLLASAELARSRGRVDEARTLLTQGLGQKDPRFRRELAGLELEDGKPARAVELLREAVKLNPGAAELWELATLFIDANQPADAKAIIARLRAGATNSPVVNYLDGRLHLSQGDVATAVQLFEQCRTEFVRAREFALPTELLLAECYQRLGQTDQRLDAARKATRIDPASAPARLALAAALLAAGEADEAVAQYRSVLRRVPEVGLMIARVRLWQARGLPRDRQDLREVEALLAEVPDRVKASPEYLLTRAELLAEQGKRADARRALEAARDKDPAEPRYWLALATMAAADGGPAGGLAVLAAAPERTRDGVELRLARAALLLRQDPDPAALRPLEAGADDFPAADRDRLQLGLAEAYTRAKAPADAERLLRAVAGRRPKDPAVLSRLFDVVAAKGNPDEVGAVAEQLRAAELSRPAEDRVLSRFADAYRHWLLYRKDQKATGDLVIARTHLTDVGKKRPGWSRVPLLEGEIEDQVGSIDVAIEKYRQAVRLGARYPAVVQRLVHLLITRNRPNEAREVLNALRTPTRSLPEELAKSEAALAVLQQEPADQTVKLAEAAVPKDSKDHRDHLWLGHVYWSIGRLKPAEDAFRQAVRLAGTAPEAWVSLVAFLHQTGRTADARTEVEAAGRAVPPEKRAQTLAPCHEIVGDRAEADKHYAAWLREAANDPAAVRAAATFYLRGGDLGKARPLLRQLSTDGTAPELRRWARRTLAVTLAGEGSNAAETSEAIGLLDKNLAERPGSPEDLRARALVHAVRPGGRRQSIKDLEASGGVSPAPGEEFLLARLYELDGDWAKAKERFEGLLTKEEGRNPTYLAHYVRSLLRRDDLPGAAAWLARLEGMKTPTAAALTVELKARLAAKLGKREEAANLLKGYARSAYQEQGKEKANPVVLRNVGLILAEVGAVGDAEDVLKQYVAAAGPKDPSAVLVLVEFLARQNRVGEALALCTTVQAVVGPEPAARYAVGAVRLGAAAPADFAQAEAIIRQALAAKRDSIDLQISLADLRDAQGRYDEAKQAYREILAKDPGNRMALNNLAWLLALHEGNAAEALGLIDRAIVAAGRVADLLDTRGVILALAGRGDQAVGELGEAAAQTPVSYTFFHLAQAHHRAGQTYEAQRALRQAKELKLEKKQLHPLEWASYDALLAAVGDR